MTVDGIADPKRAVAREAPSADLPGPGAGLAEWIAGAGAEGVSGRLHFRPTQDRAFERPEQGGEDGPAQRLVLIEGEARRPGRARRIAEAAQRRRRGIRRAAREGQSLAAPLLAAVERL